jgi:hypothetical protein
MQKEYVGEKRAEYPKPKIEQVLLSVKRRN